MSRNATTAGSGNDLAVTHGAKSLAIVEVNTPPVVRELIDAMREQVAFLTPADALIVERLARIVVRLRLIDEYLDRLGGGLIDARGRPRGCWKRTRRWSTSSRRALAVASDSYPACP